MSRIGASGIALSLALGIALAAPAHAQDRPLNQPPEGFKALFNGKDLSNWRGQIAEDPREIARKTNGKTPEEIVQLQAEADRQTFEHWTVEDGVIHYDGARRIGNIETREHYGDFELMVDWKINSGGDSGIFPRNMPQVQIWDPAREGRQKMGSGGLDNNGPVQADPLKVADKPAGEWNTFHIKMVGDKVWVTLNGELVVDGKPKGNYWTNFREPPPARGPIVLQSHGTPLWFRNIYIKELDKPSGEQ